MSNIVTIDFSQVPAYAKSKSAVSEALNASLNSGIRRLSIKGGTFRYIVGGQEIGKIEERYIDLVIVNAAPHVSRTFYIKQYDKDADPTAPDCWSLNGVVPDEKVKSPQNANCATCPKNVKGSGSNDSRACRYNQRLAVVLANDIGGEVLQLQLPATSIFGEITDVGAPLQAYVKSLAARTINPASLVTQAKFDTDVESPKLTFKALRWLTNAEHELAIKKGETEAAVRAITMTVFEADGVDVKGTVELPSGTPPTAQTAPAAPPAPAPAPSPAPAATKPAAVDAGAVDEPIVRKATDVSAANNPKLADLFATWSTDD